MFMLNGTPLALDTPFTHGDIQYPANWLRLATPAERNRIGISEVPDPVAYDDRFYWAPGVPKQLEDIPAVDGEGNPMLDADGVQVISKGLKSQFIAQVKATAGSLLAATDWRIVRAAEGVKPADEATLAARAAIRAASDANEAAIQACATVDDLAALQMTWPSQDVAPAPATETADAPATA